MSLGMMLLEYLLFIGNYNIACPLGRYYLQEFTEIKYRGINTNGKM